MIAIKKMQKTVLVTRLFALLICLSGLQTAPFLFYFVIGIGTDTVGTLGMEKSRRIYISLGRWVPMVQNEPKLVFTHAKEQVELVRRPI